jgi:hypothetical protein
VLHRSERRRVSEYETVSRLVHDLQETTGPQIDRLQQAAPPAVAEPAVARYRGQLEGGRAILVGIGEAMHGYPDRAPDRQTVTDWRAQTGQLIAEGHTVAHRMEAIDADRSATYGTTREVRRVRPVRLRIADGVLWVFRKIRALLQVVAVLVLLAALLNLGLLLFGQSTGGAPFSEGEEGWTTVWQSSVMAVGLFAAGMVVGMIGLLLWWAIVPQEVRLARAYDPDPDDQLA